jgi:hypothetical protein
MLGISPRTLERLLKDLKGAGHPIEGTWDRLPTCKAFADEDEARRELSSIRDRMIPTVPRP